jgi:hypothetical protein
VRFRFSASVFPSIAHQSSLDKLQQHLQIEAESLPQPLVRKVETLLRNSVQRFKTRASARRLASREHFYGRKSMAGWRLTPKGIIGELEYEVIPFLMNNFPQQDSVVATQFRVDTFARELNLQPERILSWALCYAVLSAWWSIEDQTEGASKASQQRASLSNCWHDTARQWNNCYIGRIVTYEYSIRSLCNAIAPVYPQPVRITVFGSGIIRVEPMWRLSLWALPASRRATRCLRRTRAGAAKCASI